jgi:thiol:disulfide interchange protein DsbA
MKTKLSVLLVSFLMLPLVVNAQIKGVFELVPPATPPAAGSLDQVEIVEVFSFGCGHCYNLNRELPALKKRFGNKIKLSSNPIGWQGHDPGRLYYIAEEKGKGEKVKDMIFDFIHVKGIGGRMYSRDKLKFVAKLNNLTKEFETRMDDPKIVSRMNKSVSYAKEKQITGTPTLVIEGVIKASGDVHNLALIINSLLKKPVK